MVIIVWMKDKGYLERWILPTYGCNDEFACFQAFGIERTEEGSDLRRLKIACNGPVTLYSNTMYESIRNRSIYSSTAGPLGCNGAQIRS